MRRIAIGLALLLAACGNADDIPGHDDLVRQVERKRIGSGTDHWIEMKNIVGEWERIGLIFGYYDDYEECTKAIAGLQQANTSREYRCTPAN